MCKESFFATIKRSCPTHAKGVGQTDPIFVIRAQGLSTHMGHIRIGGLLSKRSPFCIESCKERLLKASLENFLRVAHKKCFNLPKLHIWTWLGFSEMHSFSFRRSARPLASLPSQTTDRRCSPEPHDVEHSVHSPVWKRNTCGSKLEIVF